eukprot:m.97508 g.97508  ORF g.97508 m.97508 type:complete len:60 (-) comp13103_c0_seq1:9010-9189(-)
MDSKRLNRAYHSGSKQHPNSVRCDFEKQTQNSDHDEQNTQEKVEIESRRTSVEKKSNHE